jgi:hypothetical protein
MRATRTLASIGRGTGRAVRRFVVSLFAGAAITTSAWAGADIDPRGPERFHVELEAGPVWQSRNDVEIPNDGSATRFSLKELAGTGPWPAARLYFAGNINEKHGLRLLLAPLSYEETGTFDEPVRFAGETYAADAPTQATYRFNSWRVTYRYRFWKSERWTWWVGGTAKIRDAKVELRQGDVTSRDTDLGFVPLAYIRGDWMFAGRWHLQLEADALAGGPGRAEDVSIKVARGLGEHWTVSGGYRTLEGGADVDEVYNFGWFHYAVASATYRWGSAGG